MSASSTRWSGGLQAAVGGLKPAATLVVILLVPQVVSACPVCFGGASSVAKGMDSAIWFLLGVLGFVQIGFIALFWSFWRRSRALRRRREEFHLIEGGAR